MDERALQGLRILLVEDEPRIAMLIADVLEGEGCRIIGPMQRLPAAAAAVRRGGFDLSLAGRNADGTV